MVFECRSRQGVDSGGEIMKVVDSGGEIMKVYLYMATIEDPREVHLGIIVVI
uniref:Uncharacterized protein n=1 Tax=Solanum lycopersicum TaxID=4081 RepID=A0A3Q7IVT5_SOLLC